MYLWTYLFVLSWYSSVLLKKQDLIYAEVNGRSAGRVLFWLDCSVTSDHWLAEVTWVWTFDCNFKTIGRKPINQTGLHSQEDPLSNDMKFNGGTSSAKMWLTRMWSIFRRNAGRERGRARRLQWVNNGQLPWPANDQVNIHYRHEQVHVHIQ